MHLRNKIIVMVTLLFSIIIFAQEPVVQIDFDVHDNQYQGISIPETPEHLFAAQQHSFSEGLEGRAIDFSKDGTIRMPLKLKPEEELEYHAKTSLTVELWVKAKPDAGQGTPIAGNKKDKNTENKGWLIYAEEDGSWSLSVSDGKHQHIYKPTVKRQKINDGKWHQIAFTIDRVKEEIWMYFDGVNVAIYNASGLKDLKSDLETTFVGTSGRWEYFGQWEAFNGYMDNISVWEAVLPTAKISENYQKYFQQNKPIYPINELKLFTWNIWQGGKRFGKEVGLDRVINIIKDANPDVVTLIETYGSGEEIADALGYHFYLVSSNLSIMSRFPIKKTIKAFKSFNFGGVVLQVDQDKEIVVLDTWLHYLPDYHSNIIKGEITSEELVKEEADTRLNEINQILKEIKPILDNADKTPIIMAGDFNTNSHLDWTEATKDAHLGYVVEWPVTKVMHNHGFTDSYRELNPNPLIDPGYSAWPYSRRFGQRYVESRIDYIFYKGRNIRALESKVVNYHPIMFPSDHAAFLTIFQLK
ncbi:hypothetical protein HCG49_12895 [Arenibacter sp. 6A1]|uniref:endonuclease/exonuclease/phosphatase family protein n=1 Tax=Arenibacter sp. 6A1 TaxID=2720391 RepID=UPI001444A7C1|nr:endonuclease/exonuclease/phosphatase family protein [Arenibacter sp. 6A1]NKI27460.1 hypothetical protein [Arenibacter sp. 6A1]